MIEEDGAAKGEYAMAAEDGRWVRDEVTQVQWEESSWCRELEWTGESGNDSDAESSLWQLLNCVRLFVTPWTVAHQASPSITNSQSLLRFMSVELVMPSNHLILCHPLLLLPSIFPGIRSFPVSQFFASGGLSIGASASASVLPMNILD